jgi:DNA segregation ATPase FtsK/SpoIIIE-like protein|tara:strand:+ start:616 stop:873 length:258 start_codon:yes stop_codon:yes gene_type:complete
MIRDLEGTGSDFGVEANGQPQDEAHALTYENESAIQRTVTIPLREYDKLQEQKNYITSKTLIDIIDNVERLVRALRKHIVRTDIK